MGTQSAIPMPVNNGRAPSGSASADGPRKKGRKSPEKSPTEDLDNEEGHLKLKDGLVLAGRYNVKRMLGEGTFGRVFDCTDSERGGAKVATKVIRAVERYKHDAMVEASVLDELAVLDPNNNFQCVRLIDRGEAYGHYLLIFEALGPSLAEELELRHYAPFSMRRIRSFGRDMLVAIAFMHSHKLIHTDLKLPNVLLEMDTRDCTHVKVIDFGGTRRTTSGRKHKSLVQTRQYRAPEVILESGWSYACDLWSIGCMMMELYTSDLLFPVHHTDEHLAVISHVCGSIPKHMVPASSNYFNSKGELSEPNAFPNTRARHVRHRQNLKEIIRPRDAEFYDAVQQMLTVDPNQRITAAAALKHPFFADNRASSKAVAPATAAPEVSVSRAPESRDTSMQNLDRASQRLSRPQNQSNSRAASTALRASEK